MIDDTVKSPSVRRRRIALHLQSLRRTVKYASFLKMIRARCAPLSPAPQAASTTSGFPVSCALHLKLFTAPSLSLDFL